MTPDLTNGSDDEQADSRQQEGTSMAEKAVMVVSIAFTISLLAFAGWQMATAPSADAEPTVSVVETKTMENGSVAVTVRLWNPKNVGLVSATVSSDCATPPAEVGFTYVPADSGQTGTIVCPPGTTDPKVSMANWVTQ
jgi:hypothetical protein